MPLHRLMLFRHAKSARPTGVEDQARPLTDRGREASARMGQYMAKTTLVPDLVIISPALRTEETWYLARPAFSSEIARRTEARIYAAPANAILQVICKTPPAVRTLLLVGHNPGLHELALTLAGSGTQSDLARLAEKFPTAALVVIDFDIDGWRDVAAAAGKLERFETPGSIGAPADDE